MVWDCKACTFRNLNDGSKSCITCGTERSRESVEIDRTGENSKPPSGGTVGYKKRPVSTQRTLFGGVVDESKRDPKKSKVSSKKAKDISAQKVSANVDHNQQGQTTKTSAMAAVSYQSTISHNSTITGYRPINKEPYPVLKKRSQEILQQVFGIEKLRNQQPKAVADFLQDKSCIVVMATGGGKSLCYQLPASVKGGTTIVISPLIALMKDQVDSLQKKGVAAACINSSNGEKENVKIMERMLGRSMSTTNKSKKGTGEQGLLPLTLVYCTPELMQTQRFYNILEELYKKNRLAGIALDEAHCVSSWGHDFRPAYRKLNFIPRAFPRIPCMALTATATPKVIDDLRKTLQLEDAPCHIGSFDRPNIFYKVHYKDYLDGLNSGGTLDDMAKFIAKQHKRAENNAAPIAGIVYCHKRDDTIFVAKEITKRTGIVAAGYHGGLKDAERTKVQKDWTTGKVPIVVATISFGMGIDSENVRYVIHYNIPKSMASFYQESGRAGRDGQSAISLVYYSKDDANKFAFLISKREDSRKKGKGDGSAKRDEQALQEVVEFCTTPHCRRQYVLKHFGEKETDPQTVCQKSCDFCCNPERIEQAIQSAMAVRTMSFQKKQASKTKKQAKWDGQWDNPHGDDDYGDEAYDEWNVDGLRITSSAAGEDGGALMVESGFKTAKSMVDWDRLEKLESKAMGNQENHPSGFIRFKAAGDSSGNRQARDVYPEHVREAIYARTEGLNKSKPAQPKTTTSAEHAANAVSIQAQIEAIRKQRERLEAKKKSSSFKSTSALPPAPPAYTSSTANKYCKKR